MVHPLHIRALLGKIDSESEDDGYFNGKYHGEKYVFGDGKVFKDLVCLLQKRSAYRRFVHTERIIRSGALPRRMSGHLNAPYRANMTRMGALTIIGRPDKEH